jgi:hypothetical protein
MNDMNDRIYAFEEAQGHLEEALDLVRQAVRGTRLEDRADAYIIPSLAMCIGDDHGYLAHQPSNLTEMIQALHEYNDEDE